MKTKGPSTTSTLRLLTLVAYSAKTIRRCLSSTGVLVIKPGSLGDVLLFSGVLSLIRKQDASRKLFFLTSSRAREAANLVGHGYRKMFFADSATKRFPKLHQFAYLCSLLIVIARVDTVWIHTLKRSLAMEQMVGALKKAGVSNIYWEVFEEYGRTPRHILDSFTALARHIKKDESLNREQIEPEIIIDELLKRRAAELIRRDGDVPNEGVNIVLAPGARYAVKEWDESNYVCVLKKAAESFDIRCLIVGGEEIRKKAERICRSLQKYGVKGINLCGACSVADSIAVIASSDIYVGNDTYAAHVATICGIPSVVAMWAGSSTGWGAWKDVHIHDYISASCPLAQQCNGVCNQEQDRCIERISREIVEKAVLKHLTVLKNKCQELA